MLLTNKHIIIIIIIILLLWVVRSRFSLIAAQPAAVDFKTSIFIHIPPESKSGNTNAK